MAPPVEISIPSTSTSTASDTHSKPYTLYNITVRLPLRSFVVQKRYSEFAVLRDTLCAHVGTPPPEPLPSRSWLRSTVSSPELTQDRQRGLENWLRAIAESPDRRWRDTAAWRAFLSLPPAGSSDSLSTCTFSGAGGVPTDPTTWLDQHREMKACLHESRLSLARRDAVIDVSASNHSSEAAEAGAAAKRALVRAGSLLSGLTDGLKGIRDGGKLGDGEIRRRNDLLAAARVEWEGLERLSNSMSSMHADTATAKTSSDRAALLSGGSGTGFGSRRVIGAAPVPETERTRELDNEGVLQLQKEEMAAQDEQVRQLGAIIRRQKEMGLDIQGEVELHTEMLGALNDDVGRVGSKVQVANKRIRKLGGN